MSAVSLDAVKAYLKIDGTSDDQVLQSVLDAAERVIAGRVGPLSVMSITERCTTSGGDIVLNVTPIVDVTSLGPIGGSGLDLSSLHIDTESGVIGLADGSRVGRGTYDVTYTAGWAEQSDSLPADLELAVKEFVRHLWQSSQRGGSRRAGTTPTDGFASSGYLIPNAVASLLYAYTLPGFA